MREQIHNYLIKTLRITVKILFVALFIRVVIAEPGRVEGLSMQPNFKNNSLFIVNKVAYLIATPQRFDVIQAYDSTSPDKILIKRIIGLPGEELEFRENKIHLKKANGDEELLEEQYLPKDMLNALPPGVSPHTQIPEDSYYIMGDNRIESRDSRFFGPLHRRSIIGKVITFH